MPKCSLDAPFMHFLDCYPTEESAIQYLEKARWPDGAYCPKCGNVDVRRGRTKKRRPDWYCSACGIRFSVTVGTVMEGTKLPLRSWLVAYHMMASSKKGISALQVSRILSIAYRSAWHLCHRIRFAMQEPLSKPLTGIVESDETYIGGRRKHVGSGYRGNKAVVQAIVQRKGKAQSIILNPDEKVDGRTVGAKLRTVADPTQSVLMTDESKIYTETGKRFIDHLSVNHKREEYVRHDPETGLLAHTNTVEGLFANLKRQIVGTHHHTSKKHLPRYLGEYDFKYNHRTIKDGARALLAVKGGEGKRLTLYKAKTFKAPSLRVRETPK